ncbi:MAG: hypothetical protein NC041_01590 [Bacteroides sp.]|nr:hypothetical protein [Prevotella sp.]MCM1407704.1 hypothetical protein [Treponema brennaborense]MCM1469146.1 hypothetical protein [Bacteroides sp.]
MKKLLFVLTACFACIGCDLPNIDTNTDVHTHTDANSGNAFPAAVHKSSDEAVDFYKTLFGTWRQIRYRIGLNGSNVLTSPADSLLVRFEDGYIKVNDAIYPFSVRDDIYMGDEIDKNDSEYEKFYGIYYIKLNGYDRNYFKIKSWGDGTLSLSYFDDYFMRTFDAEAEK